MKRHLVAYGKIMSALDSITPSEGPTSGGTVVTLSGVNLVDPSMEMLLDVSFGNRSCDHIRIVDSSKVIHACST